MFVNKAAATFVKLSYNYSLIILEELSVRLPVMVNYNNCTMQNDSQPFITVPSFKPSFNIGIDFLLNKASMYLPTLWLLSRIFYIHNVKLSPVE
jgi:hypothetical protein